MEEGKALGEVEFWKLVGMTAVFLLQVVFFAFVKNYFGKLDTKLDGIEDKIDSLEDAHNSISHTLIKHDFRIANLEKK